MSWFPNSQPQHQAGASSGRDGWRCGGQRPRVWSRMELGEDGPP